MKRALCIAFAAFALGLASCSEPVPAEQTDPAPAQTRSVGDTLTSFDEVYVAPWPLKNLSGNDRIFVARSSKELARFVDYPNDSVPDIDFSKYSVINACGTSPNSVGGICTSLIRHGGGYCRFSVQVSQGMLCSTEHWQISVVVPRIGPEERVGLETTYTNPYLDAGRVCMLATSEDSHVAPWPLKSFPEHGKIFIARSAGELAAFVGYPDNSVPNLDFSKYSVLNVSGVTSSRIARVVACLGPEGPATSGKYRYTLTVEVYLNAVAVMDKWKVSMPVQPAIGPDEEVELVVQYRY